MILPEELCNRSPGICVLVIRKETPSPLPVGCPMDGLLNLTRQHCVVVTPGYRPILLLPATVSPALPGGPLRLGILHQA